MPKPRNVTWWQITAGLLFTGILLAGLGLLIAAVILGIRAAFDSPLRLLVAAPALVAVTVAYGKWVWAPLWKIRPSQRR